MRITKISANDNCYYLTNINGCIYKFIIFKDDKDNYYLAGYYPFLLNLKIAMGNEYDRFLEFVKQNNYNFFNDNEYRLFNLLKKYVKKNKIDIHLDEFKIIDERYYYPAIFIIEKHLENYFRAKSIWIQGSKAEKLIYVIRKSFAVEESNEIEIDIENIIKDKTKKEIVNEWVKDWINLTKIDLESVDIDKNKLNDISKEELIFVLYDVISQVCWEYDKNYMHSGCRSAYARAIAYLYKAGLIEELKYPLARRALFKLKDIYK